MASLTTLFVAVGSFFGFILAYHTYGRWLARRVFQIDSTAQVPSHELRDDVDYVPTHRQVIFGHHFTSIAGTGPIVGPAIAVFWGWLPALLWVISDPSLSEPSMTLALWSSRFAIGGKPSVKSLDV